LGFRHWAPSPIPNPQSPIPNPQSPILKIIFLKYQKKNMLKKVIKIYFDKYKKLNKI